MIKYVCMVTLGVLSGGTLIKPDSPKTDEGLHTFDLTKGIPDQGQATP